nr:ABC transporter ATP-binding protein [Paraburkholderia phytofirmans]
MNLTSGYGESMVVRNLALDVAPGEIVAVLGKNGMGKTTLLRTVMGFLGKKTGSVALDGKDITVMPPHRIARLGIGYVAQEKALFQDLTVRENLRLATRNRPLAEVIETAAAAFPFLAQRLGQRAGTLSGGEQKMLLMARALATRARLVLVDEITEGLQPAMVQRIGEVIRLQRERYGTSFLLIEQHLGFALKLADRYVVVQGGEIVLCGNRGEADTNGRIAQYLGV